MSLSFCHAAFASVASELQAGVDLYGAQNYDAAIKQLSRVVIEDPSSAEAHYLLGCCYTRLNIVQSADREYQAAVKLDARGQVGMMARTALKNLTVTQNVQPAAVATAGSVAPVRPNAVTNTLARIQEQANAEKQRQEISGNAIADATIRTANGQVDKMQSEKRSTINSMRNAIITDKNGYTVPVYSEAEIQRASDNFDNRISLLVSNSKDKAQQQLDFAKAKMSGIDQVARDLASQMRNEGGGIKLLPNGTNLYVRTYVNGSSSPADSSAAIKPSIPEQLAASQDKLILEPIAHPGKTVSHVVPAPLSASPDKMTVPGQGERSSRELNVHGRITHI